MKYKFTIFALLFAIPSVALATANFLNTDPTYIISKTEQEDRPVSKVQNYRLQWNQAIGKFDLLPGDERRPITIEESMPPIPKDPQVFEPIYYSDDFSI